jgi:hypothetical protein
MSDIDFDRFLKSLSAKSEKQVLDPAALDWPDAVDEDGWYFTPELISLYGTPAWAALDERQRKRLSLCEAVNFFSMNVHGEKYLISEIGRNLYQDDNYELSRYLLHFVAEESRHMMYFTGFCMRYAGRISADRTVHPGASDDAELDRLLLFVRINVFEEIVDHYNRTMARDARLVPIVREINRMHHVEELRHLAFGRRFLAQYVERHVSDWSDVRREELSRRLSGYLQHTWKQYSNPAIYADAGLCDAFTLWRDASASPAVKERRRNINDQRLRFLRRLALLEDDE